jgi:hypothetical protein
MYIEWRHKNKDLAIFGILWAGITNPFIAMVLILFVPKRWVQKLAAWYARKGVTIGPRYTMWTAIAIATTVALQVWSVDTAYSNYTNTKYDPNSFVPDPNPTETFTPWIPPVKVCEVQRPDKCYWMNKQ